MAGEFPNLGDGARQKAVADAKLLISEGEVSFREIIRILREKYSIADSTAYQYRLEGARELGIETIDEQITIGMLATRGGLRCAQEGEILARTMGTEAESLKDRDMASAAFARAGRTYIQVAQAAIRLDVGEMMSDDEQAEIISAAVVTNVHRLSPRLRRRMREALDNGPGESTH
jgi:hypothetical protein